MRPERALNVELEYGSPDPHHPYVYETFTVGALRADARSRAGRHSMFSHVSRPAPPRFVTRTLIATLGIMAFVFSAVFVVVTLSVRGQVRQSVVEKLDTGQRLLDKLEQQRLDTPRTQALDDRYASELSDLFGAHTLVVEDEAIRATTLPAKTVAALTPGLLRTLGAGGLTTIGREQYAVRPLLDQGNAKVYALQSVDVSAGPLVAASLQRMGVIALGAFALAAVASLWLARTVARPIDNLSASLAEMTRRRKFDRPLAASGASLEVDSLTEALNSMMASITSAQGETARAYLEAIRALTFRPALSQAVAMRELQRCAGTDLDPEAVRALAIVISTTTAAASVAAIDEAFPAEVAPPRAAAQPAAVTVDALDEFGCETPGA
jgi:hypothetical protein